MGLALLVLVSASTPTAIAQEGGDPRRQREQVRARRADVALQLDTLRADDAQVSDALRALDENVRGQQGLLADAEHARDAAQREAAEAEGKAAAKAAEVRGLEARMAVVAVDSYVNPPGEDLLDRFRADSAQQAAEKRALVTTRMGTTADLIDELRRAKRELEDEKKRAEAARERAEGERAEAGDRLAKLVEAQAAQQSVASELQTRLDSRLAEAASLASYDKVLSDRLASEQAQLAAQLRALTPAPSQESGSPVANVDPSPPVRPPPTGTPTDPQAPAPPVGGGGTRPTRVPLTTVGGITVNTSIAGQLGALLAAARADGVVLGGSGYRDPSGQIALRRQNCGTSDYAIYDMPPSDCTPPTARPGSSNHEQGLAIDFTYAGGSIESQNNPGYLWLAANAARFGFYNLPSEPWHWSVNGR